MCKFLNKAFAKTTELGNRRLLRTNAEAHQQKPYMFDKHFKFRATTSYGGRHVVSMIPGTGKGPELMSFVRDAFDAVGAPVDFEIIEVDPNLEAYEDIDTAIRSIRRHSVGIIGQLVSSPGKGRLKDLAFQQKLDLFVSVVQCRSEKGIPGKFKDVDVVIIRQNRDGEYKLLEHESVPGVVSGLKIVTRDTASRVTKYAFEFAKLHDRKKITVIHKANVLKMSDGLFLKTAMNVASQYPDIKCEAMRVSNAAMNVVMNPHQFDVILTLNLYGSLLVHTLCGVIGGHAMVYDTHISDRYIVFELGTRAFLRHFYLTQKIVNPVPILSAASAMLTALGHKKHGLLIRQSVYKTTFRDGLKTPDWGGKNTSAEVMNSILKRIQKHTPVF